MKILDLFIPKNKAQVIKEVESWTIKWKVATSLCWGDAETFNKVFIKEEEANEFEKQLKESARFIKTPILTEKIKN